MEYIEYAKLKFDEIKSSSPANNCDVCGNVIDAGVNVPGGWTSVKCLLEGLLGGRGIVNFGRQFRGANQLPSIEILFDAPTMALKLGFTPDNCGVLGVKDGEKYVLGVSLTDDIDGLQGKGNIVAAKKSSLLGTALCAASAAPLAVKALLSAGVSADDIVWAWSSSPVAMMASDDEVLTERIQQSLEKSIISVWVRGSDATFIPIVSDYQNGVLRLHNLVSGKTICNG